MTYKDRTFCISPNCQNGCGRQLTDEMSKEAESLGDFISVSYFCGGWSHIIDEEKYNELLDELSMPPSPNDRLIKTMRIKAPWDDKNEGTS